MPLSRVFTGIAFGIAVLALTAPAHASEKNRYQRTVFVANKGSYKPQLMTEPKFINAWGIAKRPQGAGGHFWITASNASYQFVGDVQNSADTQMRDIHQTDTKIVHLPVGGEENVATSVVFSESKESFVITQDVPNAEPITAPAKFLFASDGGIISAWTERKKADGSFDRAENAITVVDASNKGVQFFGLASNAASNRLYAANFGAGPDIKVYDAAFKPVALPFDLPFDDNKNGKVDPGEYAPFNIQNLKTPSGEHHLFVAYAKTQACTAEGIKEDACQKGELFAGEEDTSKPGMGRVAEFTEDGKLVTVWKDGGKLSAPWGMVFAPSNFGALSGTLLVANFGSGTIAAYDPKTHAFVDVVRDGKGKPMLIDKIWGLLFGNGESLGDSNALYFTAGPDDENDGMWGSIRTSQR